MTARSRTAGAAPATSTTPHATLGPGGERMQIVIAGHVDHGKSTVIGRLLADTGALPEGKLEQVRRTCERTAKPFEYAFLLDALKDEQAQGITIDAARVFFRTARRHYLVLDAPGHIEFVKNMVTGAARAEAALLVIDAHEGVRENSRRHGYLLGMLGIRQLAIVVNKMDLVGYDEAAFARVADEYRAFLAGIGVTPSAVIPAAARDGVHIAGRGDAMPWYTGPTVLEALDAFAAEEPPVDQPFRMPVQDVYKFTGQGDDRRIIAGTVETGSLAVGDDVVFYPSGKRARVRSLERFNAPAPDAARAGEATGFTIEQQLYVARGEIAARDGEPRPRVGTRLRVSLFWLGRTPLTLGKEYIVKIGTARVPAELESIQRVIDAGGDAADREATAVARHEVAECTLVLRRPIAFDLVEELAPTSRFVLVEHFEISGGGIIREALSDAQSWVRDRVLLRNYKWEPSAIGPERRAERYSQRPIVVLITGADEVDRKALARRLESRLFEEGRVVYFIGIGNILYGVDSDIERSQENRTEHLRRLGEVANLMVDAGMLLVVTAAELTQDDLELIRTSVPPNRIVAVWVGDRLTTDLACDIHLPAGLSTDESVDRIKDWLHERGMVFRPW